MSDTNSVTLSGEVAGEPRVFDRGPAVFRVKTSHSFKTREGKPKTVSQTFNVVAWNDNKEAAEELSEGDPITINGRLENNFYERDGIKKYEVRVVAETINSTQSTLQSASGGDGWE